MFQIVYWECHYNLLYSYHVLLYFIWYLELPKDSIHKSITLLTILLLPYIIVSHFMFSYITILDYFHIPGNVPKLDKWKIKTMMMISIEEENVQVVFSPLNTTSLLQPLYRGIIRCVKASYTRQVFEMFRVVIDAEPSLQVKDS